MGWSCLHYALYGQHEDCARVLLQHGATDQADEHGRTCLALALAQGQLAAARLMLTTDSAQVRTDVHDVEHGSSVLHAAVFAGQPELVQLLLQRGADANHADANQATPLFFACEQGADELVELLVAAGADARGVDNEGRSALHFAAMSDRCTTCELLVGTHGLDINATDQDGRSALHTAAYAGHAATVAVLVRLGANVDAQDSQGISTLHWAATAGSLPCCRALVEAGAFVNPTELHEERYTPLDYALLGNHIDVVEYLQAQGGLQIEQVRELASRHVQSWWRGFQARLQFHRAYQGFLRHQERLQYMAGGRQKSLPVRAPTNLAQAAPPPPPPNTYQPKVVVRRKRRRRSKDPLTQLKTASTPGLAQAARPTQKRPSLNQAPVLPAIGPLDALREQDEDEYYYEEEAEEEEELMHDTEDTSADDHRARETDLDSEEHSPPPRQRALSLEPAPPPRFEADAQRLLLARLQHQDTELLATSATQSSVSRFRSPAGGRSQQLVRRNTVAAMPLKDVKSKIGSFRKPPPPPPAAKKRAPHHLVPLWLTKGANLSTHQSVRTSLEPSAEDRVVVQRERVRKLTVRAKVEAAMVIQRCYRRWKARLEAQAELRKLNKPLIRKDQTKYRLRRKSKLVNGPPPAWLDPADSHQQIAALTIQLAWRRHLQHAPRPARATARPSVNAPAPTGQLTRPTGGKIFPWSPGVQAEIRRAQQNKVYANRLPPRAWRPLPRRAAPAPGPPRPSPAVETFSKAFDTYAHNLILNDGDLSPARPQGDGEPDDDEPSLAELQNLADATLVRVKTRLAAVS